MAELDELDRGLIAALRRNARTAISDLAAELGVTRATVRARIDRLERQGEILGFTVVLRSDAFDAPVRGATMIEISGRGADRVIRALEGLAEVQAIHTTNGRWDLVVELGAETLSALDAVLRRIRLIDGVENSETSIFLATRRGGRTARTASRDAQPARPDDEPAPS